MLPLCSLVASSKKALDELAVNTISHAVIAQITHIICLVKKYTCIDLIALFECLTILIVLCWLSTMIKDMIDLLFCKIPKFIKNLLKGKIDFCFFECDRTCGSHSSKSSCSKSSSSTSSSSCSSITTQTKPKSKSCITEKKPCKKSCKSSSSSSSSLSDF